MASKTIEDKTYWLKQIAGYKNSGLSKMAYCRQTRVSYCRFLYWLEKLAKHNDCQLTLQEDEGFIPIKPLSSAKLSSEQVMCVLELKQGHRLLIRDEAVLEKVFMLLSN